MYVYMYALSRSDVYRASAARHNKLRTVIKRTYFMAVIDGVFCAEHRVINPRETRFDRPASLERDYGKL